MRKQIVTERTPNYLALWVQADGSYKREWLELASSVSLRPHAIAVLNCVERLPWPLEQRRQLVWITLHGMFTAVRVNCLNPSHSNRVWDRILSTYYNRLSHPPTLGVSNKQSYTDPGWTLKGHCRQSLPSIPAPLSSPPQTAWLY